jgi:predicted DNA-binding ArsR family transcriptional regulator
MTHTDKIKKLYKELKEDVYIDKHKLDEECTKHTFIYIRWAKRLALAEANYRKAEKELTIFKASKMVEAKQVAKTTDRMAENAYRTSKSYASIAKRMSNLKQTVDLMQSAIYAMRTRQSMLETLVKLQAMNYYGET